jgi:hypothetical protein
MSLDPSPESGLRLPELRTPASEEAPPDRAAPRRGGLFIAFGMIILLTLLVYLNMG